MDGNIMGRTKIDPSNAVEGFRLIIGNKQIEVRIYINVSTISDIEKNNKVFLFQIIDQVSQLSIPSVKKHLEEIVEKPLFKKLKTSTLPFVSKVKEDSSDCKTEILNIDSSQADTKV